ncbi:MAG: peroxiredoxin [Bacteroidetes bacterium]|nr:MAG: peroxiredoxin [Bacteroidota bacterium]
MANVTGFFGHCLLLFAFLLSYSPASAETTTWRGELLLNDSTILPFNFEIVRENGKTTVIIRNAEERIVCDEVRDTKDSLNWRMPVFDSEFFCKKKNDSIISGWWSNHSRKTTQNIRFRANKNQPWRFKKNVGITVDYSGRWQTTFSPGSEKDLTMAVGEFKQSGGKVTGTFLTETGDYRFLEGDVSADSLWLSCFDGSHAFLFKAKYDMRHGFLTGGFWSGSHWQEPWQAFRNDTAHLRDPEKLTFAVDTTQGIYFSFLNTEKRPVSPVDERYKGKVLILQVMGSWCPNCMDETAMLADLYKRYNNKGLEIIGLAYERTTDFDRSAASVNRLKKHFGVEYEILVTGKTGKDEAGQSLPFLNGIMAFPTTIWIDKRGRIRKIYTGYIGPGTGASHQKFLDETTRFMEMLLAE